MPINIYSMFTPHKVFRSYIYIYIFVWISVMGIENLQFTYISRKILLGMLHLETPTLVGPFCNLGSNTVFVFFSHIAYTWYTILSVLISFVLEVIVSWNVGLSTFELFCDPLWVITCPVVFTQRLVVILQQHILYFSAVKHNNQTG
jgi:hypothetical protein